MQLNAIKAVGTLIKETNTPVVHRKEFDGTVQQSGESFKEFVTRLKGCAADCNFVCPFDDGHNLTEYHVINRIRSGVSDDILQQELLQKSASLNTLTNITVYCKKIEAAKNDREKLSSRSTMISGIEAEDMTKDDIVAAISTYRRNKHSAKVNKPGPVKKCFNCGYDWPHTKGQDSCPAKDQDCKKCQKKGHFERVCRNTAKQISTFIISGIQRVATLSNTEKSEIPKLNVWVGLTCKDDPPVPVEVIVDTGAQVTVAGIRHLKKLGIKQEQLQVPPHSLKQAGGSAQDHRKPSSLYCT